MSYILDALKKAHRERNLAKVPTLTTVHIPVFVATKRITLWTVTGGLLIGGLLFWFLRPSTTGVPGGAVDDRRGAGATPSVNMSGPTLPAALNQRIKVPPSSLPGPALPGPSAEIRQEPLRQPDREPVVMFRPSRPSPAGPSKPVPQPTQIERVEPRPAPPESASPPSPPGPQPSGEGGQVRMDASVPSPTSPPANQATLRDALARMSLDVFVYADSEADRMVTINGRRYVKGQLVEGRYLVEEITAEGVLLSFQGERAVLRP